MTADGGPATSVDVAATGAPLRIDGLGARYPGRREPSLEGVSVEVGAGERVGVAGRTGAGKSTLALAAAGFIPRVVRAKLAGHVTIDGMDGATAPAGALLGRVGIVFATPANQLSASKLTVREELAFGLENLGVPRAEMDGRIDVTLARLAIGHLADREPFALSGGEQQRVAIASIVAMGTSILVLDEPTAQLDPAGTVSVAELLDELARGGATILCVEHDPSVLGRMDRCLVLDRGGPVALDVPGVALVRAESAAGLAVPTLVRLARAAGIDLAGAFDEDAIAAGLRARAGHPEPAPVEPPTGDDGPG
jgi:energy-coupling factor transporter ATP-binding protein EcfA2